MFCSRCIQSFLMLTLHPWWSAGAHQASVFFFLLAGRTDIGQKLQGSHLNPFFNKGVTGSFPAWGELFIATFKLFESVEQWHLETESHSSQFLKRVMVVSLGSIKITFLSILSAWNQSIYRIQPWFQILTQSLFFLPSFSVKSIYHIATPEVLTQCFRVLVSNRFSC